jgi:hypothetical protein
MDAAFADVCVDTSAVPAQLPVWFATPAATGPGFANRPAIPAGRERAPATGVLSGEAAAAQPAV